MLDDFKFDLEAAFHPKINKVINIIVISIILLWP